jgi:hypothetical protein
MDLFNNSGAFFSECDRYRFALWRIWDETKPYVMFIGLNPSTANQTDDDPTIRRVKKFASNWGFGGVYMMNCFPLVSTDPAGLLEDIIVDDDGNHVKDENYILNDTYLNLIARNAGKIVFAWGNFPIVRDLKRDKELVRMFPDAEALIINQNGSPRHPLYVKSNTKTVKYEMDHVSN